jgi:hypothetical protein
MQAVVVEAELLTTVAQAQQVVLVVAVQEMQVTMLLVVQEPQIRVVVEAALILLTVLAALAAQALS